MTDLYEGTYMDGFGDDNKPKYKLEIAKIDKDKVLGASLRVMKPLKNYPLSIAQSVHLFNK